MPNPDTKKFFPRRPNAVAIIISAAVLLILLSIAGYRFYFDSFRVPEGVVKETTLFLPEAKVTAEEPVPPVLSGNQYYRLLTSETPRFTEASIEPLDAPRGTDQIITAKVENPSPVKSVSVTVITDKREKTVNMRLTQGTEYNGVWSATHTMNDAYEKIYRFRFTATDQYGSSAVTITSR